MGSSAKRKKEKKKDFQKPKLKVGKTKPKADNYTDTSFRAKSIIVKEQSIHTNAPTATAQFIQQLSHLTAKSDTQRRESLSSLTNSISAARAAGNPLPQPVSTIIPKVQSLIYDSSNAVRQQLLKLLQTLPAADITPDQVEELLRRTRAGMTSLSTDVCASAYDVLDWLLATHPDATVACAGGWVHTLKCFLSALGWRDPAATNTPGHKWTSASTPTSTSSSQSATEKLKKVRHHQLLSLTAFLRAGLVEDREAAQRERQLDEARARAAFPLHRHAFFHTVQGQHPNGFAALNLFGPPKDEDGAMYADRQARQRVFARLVRPAVESGLVNAKKEGGMIGRAAGELEKVVLEGMGDFDGEDW